MSQYELNTITVDTFRGTLVGPVSMIQ